MSFPKLNTGGPDSLLSNIGRFIGEKWSSLFSGNLLRVLCFSGLILSLLIGGSLAAVYLLGGRPIAESGGGFYRLLREYDRAAQSAGAPNMAALTENLDRELDKLETKTEGVESWLSVLKRRRQLARLNSQYIPAYRQSALRARRDFPYSEPLAALAAAALIEDAAIGPEQEAELRACLPLLADTRFDTLRLSLHVLLGDLKNPETAANSLPPVLSFDRLRNYAAGLDGSFYASEKEALAADLAMVKLLKGDPAGAAAEIQGILAASSGEFLRFAAEYFYDFGDILRSAELFSRLSDETALLRQADALWLGGYAAGARNIWSLFVSSSLDGAPGPGGIDTVSRSLYNLALSAENPAEAAALLERLIALPAAAGEDGSSRRYGLIRYSRLLDARRAVALLEAAGTGPLLELEILRRRTELGETGRLTAETWLLLGRYPEEEGLYRWGAWFFDSRRNYGETAVLLKIAARHGFTGAWAGLHEALQLVRAGNPDGAGEILIPLLVENGDWPAAANLGRLFEARGAPARALEYYETAAALLEKSEGPGIEAPAPEKAAIRVLDEADGARRRETASRIQFRIAQCLKSLDRTGESRRVLEYALDLNPDNLSARLELSRLGGF
ncbi:MAG: hypothetical protein LBD47_08610 [Treponema sp.]|jgi:hypothetical protein|nr:hypothetical protein [Treponema sp.]